MKHKNILVIYDSQFGNTKVIAESIAEGAGAQCKHVADVTHQDVEVADLLVIGCPTQGGRATVAIQNWISSIPDHLIRNHHFVSFDTRFSEQKVNAALRLLIKTFGYAGPRISETLQNMGGIPLLPAEGFIVLGKEGPLLDGEIDRAKNWLKNINS